MQSPSNAAGNIFWDQPQPFAKGAELRYRQEEEAVGPLEIDACAISLAPPPSIRPELTYGFLASLDLSTTVDSYSCGTRTSYSASSASSSATSSRCSAASATFEHASYLGVFECSTFCDRTAQMKSLDTPDAAFSMTGSTEPCSNGSDKCPVRHFDLLAGDERITKETRLASVESPAALLGSNDSDSHLGSLSYQSKVSQQQDALRDLSEELEVYLAALAERRANCPATVGSRAFATISSLVSFSRTRDNRTQQNPNASSWASATMERELTPENQPPSMLAARRRISLQNADYLASLSPLLSRQQKLQAGTTSVARHRRRSCISALASSHDVKITRQPKDENFPQRQRDEERSDAKFIEGVAALTTSLLNCGPVSQPANSFDAEVLGTVSHILERHREKWGLLLAADKRLCVASMSNDTALVALFAYVAASVLP